MRQLLLSVLLCGSVVAGWLPCVQAAAKDPPGYTEAINLGVSEFQAENFAEARAHFVRAHALYPNARTLRALGMVAFELKHYIEAAQYLTDALASRERALEGDKRAETEKLLARANGYLARYILDLGPDTDVLVDGAVKELASGSELALEVGDHVLEFRAPGRIGSRRTLTVQGGERETLHVRLPALAAEPAAPARPRPLRHEDRPPGRPVYRNPWLWTAIGLVVAGAAAGTAVALTRDRTTTRMEEPYTGTGGAPALEAP